MMKKLKWQRGLYLATGSLAIAILSHLFFITEFTKERYMTGLNDGLSQMIPFKFFLYNAYTNGDLFYSESYGLGGGIFSQLGYYFSTSIVFMLTVICTLLLVKFGLVESANVFYWADIILVISILRTTAIMLMTTLFFRMLQFNWGSAFVGATLYSTSIIYFRHVTYWEFFGDAMLFFPLLLIGAERLMRTGKVGWFIAAVALNMIDNFYFAYVNFLLTFLYICFRVFLPFDAKLLPFQRQIRLFFFAGLLGAGISAMFFIPSVYGYLNNYRPPYDDSIPLFTNVDNVLWYGRVIMLPAAALLLLFVFPFYKNRKFRFFACLTILCVILHYSPVVGSIFNGFSAPQYRWEYFLSLVAGGLVASGLEKLSQFQLRYVGVAASLATVCYGIFYLVDTKFTITSLKDGYIFICFLLFVIALLYVVFQSGRIAKLTVVSTILFTTLTTAYMFQEQRLTYRDKGQNKGPTYGITKSYMLSEQYYGKDQRELIQQLQQREADPLARIDWMVETRNNTPIVQEFNGMSVYSSILNKHLLHFYLDHLEIDMRRESVSRYASLGDRANLYSVLNGKYYITENDTSNVPFGFKEIARVGAYTAYENEFLLPFVRTTSNVFSEDMLNGHSVVTKERAMLSGVILSDEEYATSEVPKMENRFSEVKLEPMDATYGNNVLTVTAEEGGLDLVLPLENQFQEDVYVSFFIQRKTTDHDFELYVNHFKTERKQNDSIYRTKKNVVTIRVPTEERIRIRVPKGSYTLRDFSLYTEDFSLLKEKKAAQQTTPPQVVWEGNKVSTFIQNDTGDSYAVLPIPYEKGWNAYVNGERQPIERANYAFTAIPLQQGYNSISMAYYPPYFFQSTACTIASLFIVVVWGIWRKRRKRA